MKKKHKIIQFCILIISSGIIACCSNNKKYNDTPTTGKISMVADETFKPILDAELTVFHAIYEYAKINVIYKTETEALNDLLKDTVRLIISSRPLKQNEKDFFLEKKFFPKEIKIAIDGIALITNKNNPDSLISVSAFRKILLGETTQWKQLYSNSKLDDIRVVFDNKNSSTVRFMLDSLCNNKEISSHHYALKQNQEVIDYVSENKNVIGVIGVSWISDKDDSTMLSFLKKVKVMAISKDPIANYENSYQPFQGYIAKGLYPFTRNIYAIVSEPRSGLATGFTAFLASDRGQRIILKTGILPATQPYRIINAKDQY